MPKKKSRSRKKSSRSRVSRWRWLIKPGLVLLAFMVFVSIYLDAIVRAKFEGRKWALPARVYARPVELYEGLDIPAAELSAILGELGYRAVKGKPQRGHYQQAGNDFLLGTRGFKYWDGDEPARQVHVHIERNRIASMRSVAGESLPVLRLEPLQIGSIYPSEHEDRLLLKLDQVPVLITSTLIAVEDRSFYDHFGISIRGIARALFNNLTGSGGGMQGGSTITQQLVKNFYLSSERTLARKLMEAWMSILLELHYSKNEILETYLNEVYLGQDGNRAIHGFALASQHYFRQPLDELQLHQVALLIGIVKGPSYYDPWRKPERAKARRDLVLDKLADQELISVTDADRIKKLPLGVAERGAYRSGAYPAFLDLVRRQLQRDYREDDLASEGLQVFTTVDVRVQRAAERSLAEGVDDIEKRYKLKKDSLQGAVVVTAPASGEVLAVVGSRSPKYAGYNRAVEARRPIGSLIKPWVYLAALESRKYTLATIVSDDPVTWKSGKNVWRPDNYDGKNHGNVMLYDGMINSYNHVAARVGLDVGVDNVLNTLKRAGVDHSLQALPSALLGAGELSPLDVAVMYQTLAANGFVMPPRAIREVFNADGQALSRYPLEMEQRFAAAYIQQIQFAMQGVMREGTAKSISRYLPSTLKVAGKTGTTNDSRDSWFAGFSGNNNAVVWIGRDDNGKMPLTGATGALQVWGRMMRDLPNVPLPDTSDGKLVYYWVDRASGKRLAQSCGSSSIYMPFIAGTEPPQASCSGGDVLMEWINSNIFEQ